MRTTALCSLFKTTLAVVSLLTLPAVAQESAAPPADVGQYYPFLQKHADRMPRSFSYRASMGPDGLAGTVVRFGQVGTSPPCGSTQQSDISFLPPENSLYTYYRP